MKNNRNFHLLTNQSEENHGSEIVKLLRGAKRLEFMVAFAKMSGFKILGTELEKRLSKGMEARIVVGLAFFLTEPMFLREVLSLRKKFNFPFYVCSSSETFHPKIYAVSHAEGCSALVGSANLTSGGLHSNFEASVRIDDPTGAFMQEVSNHIDELENERYLTDVTEEVIRTYEREFEIHDLQRKISNAKAKQAANFEGIYVQSLSDILTLMKSDDSEYGFRQHQIKRKKHNRLALAKIQEIANAKKMNSAEFLSLYITLLKFFHSGGLNRYQTRLAENWQDFQKGVAAILSSSKLTVSQSYQLLVDHFQKIDGGGVNIISEILMATDCNRFAVMNSNSIAGMRRANIFYFPKKPSTKTVSADMYADFCDKANKIREDLELANFLELDALFNYAFHDVNKEKKGARTSHADRASA